MLDLATRRRIALVALVLVLLFGLPVGPARAGRGGLRLVRGQRPARQPERRAVPPTRRARHAVRPAWRRAQRG
jgi:hypothetical protein